MSFQQGLSGLNATSRHLEVIGNNIANAGTYGAKVARAEFADVYANSIGTTNNIGIGVQVADVVQQFTQGSVVSTSNTLDVAINGAGFFQFRDTSGTLSYSRNGQFKVDSAGHVVNSQGHRLLGYRADDQGRIIPQSSAELQLPTAGIAPRATDRVGLELNLDSRAAVTRPASGDTLAFDDPSTYNSATSATVYDVKGQPIGVTFYFQKAGADRWNVYASASGTPLARDAAGNPAPVTTMTFPGSGAAPTSPIGAVAVPLPALTQADGASTEPVPGLTVDFTSATQYGTGFNVTDLTQNGHASGQLSNLSIEANGLITARYSNGLTRSAGQVELANFRNPQGLRSVGGNGWVSTYQSGEPVGGVPGTGTLGALQAGALEESNVDMTAELVNMITAQRLYQANAQTIKTQDSVMQTLVNLR